MRKDPVWAGCNANAQVLLTGLALAAWAQLAPCLPAPAAAAGYSVGELAAFSAAGVFDANTALELAHRRAALMDCAGESNSTGLMGVSGVTESLLGRLCEEFDLAVAIRNGVDSVVLGACKSCCRSQSKRRNARARTLCFSTCRWHPIRGGWLRRRRALPRTLRRWRFVLLEFLSSAMRRAALPSRLNSSTRWPGRSITLCGGTNAWKASLGDEWHA